MWQVPKSTEAATDVALTEDIQNPKCAPRKTPIIVNSKISLVDNERISLNLSFNRKGKKSEVANVCLYEPITKGSLLLQRIRIAEVDIAKIPITRATYAIFLSLFSLFMLRD